MRKFAQLGFQDILIDDDARIQRDNLIAADYQRIDIQFLDFREIHNHIGETDQRLIE